MIYPHSQETYFFPSVYEFKADYAWMLARFDYWTISDRQRRILLKVMSFRRDFGVKETRYEHQLYVRAFAAELKKAVHEHMDPCVMWRQVVARIEQSRHDRARKREASEKIVMVDRKSRLPKTNVLVGRLRRSFQLSQHLVGLAEFQSGGNVSTVRRAERDAKQREVARAKEEAERKAEPKRDREARVKANRDKRSPVFQGGGVVPGVIAGVSTVVVCNLFQRLFRTLKKGEKLIENANSFVSALNGFKNKLRGLFGEVFWAYPLVVVGFFFINCSKGVTKNVKLLVAGAIGALLGPKLWNVMREFFHVADDVPDGVSKAEFQSGVSNVSKMVAVFMAFSVFKGKYTHHTVTEFTKRIALLDKLSFGWESFMQWSLVAFESVFNFARKLVGKERIQLFKDSHRPLKEWATKVDRMMVRGPVDKKQIDPEAIAEMSALLRQGTAFKELYRGTPMARLVEDSMAKAFMMIQPYEGAINAQNNFRIEPEFVLFQGDPGIGKTLITVPLCTTILLMSGLVPPGSSSDDIISNIWSKGTSEFWNGYSTQKAIIFDDIFQSRPDPTDKENEYISIIRAVSSWAMPLNFADLASKGKIYFNSPLLVGTCNNKSICAPAALVLHEPQAVMRRLTHPYRMRVKDEFKTDGRLDHLKYEEACIACRDNVGMDKFPWYIWEVAKHDFDTGITSDEYVPLKELVLKVAASLKRKVQAHGDAEKRNRELASSISDMMSGCNLEAHGKTEFQVGESSRPQDPRATTKGLYDASSELMKYIRQLEAGRKRFDLFLKLGLGVVGGVLVTSMLIGFMRPWLTSLWSMITGFFSSGEDKVKGVPRRKRVSEDELIVDKGKFLNSISALSEEAKVEKEYVDQFISAWEKAVDASNSRVKKDYLYVVKEVKRNVFEPLYINPNPVELQGEPVFTGSGFLNNVSAMSEEAKQEAERVDSLVNDFVKEVEFSNHRVKGVYLYTVKEIKKKVFVPLHVKPNDAEPQSNTAAVKIRSREGGAQLQAGDAIPTNIYSNTYKLFAPEGDTGFGQVTFLCDTLAVQPAHFTRHMKLKVERGELSLDSELHLVHAVNSAFTVKFSVRKYLAYDRVLHQEKDVEFLNFTDLRAHRNVVGNFISEKQINYVKGIRGRLDICRMAKYRDGYKYERMPIVMPSLKYGENLRVAGHILSRYLCYDAATYVGDCGAPVCIFDDSSFSGRACLGIHVAGDQVYGLGYAAILTKEMIDEAMKQFATIRDDFEGDIASRRVHFQVSDEMPFDNMGSFLPIGVVDKPVAICPKTSYYPVRQMYGEFGEYDYFPAPLSEVYRDGELVFPMANAVKPYSTEVLIYEPKELTHSLHVAMARLSELTKDCDRRILSFEEAVLGVPEEKFRSIPRGTAAGYPYCTELKGGKKEIFGDGADYDLTTPLALDLRARVQYMIAQARLGIRCAHVYVDFLKDELRSKAKVDAVATRLISSAPVDYTTFWRMYFGAFSAAFMRVHTKSGMAPGICVYTDWHMPANLLGSRGSRVFAGDFKAFDSSEQPSAMMVILDFINRWYDDGEENALIRRVLWMDLIHSRHIGGMGRNQRYVYQWNKSLPSGHPFTTILNSMYSLMMLVACYIRTTGDFTGFWRHVYTVTYGDDNVSNVDDEMSEKFNQVTVAKVMKEAFGLTYTSDLKDGTLEPYTTLDSVTFLKRRFVEEDGWWLCPLDLNSFLYATYWCKNRRLEHKIRVDELENCLEELSMHDQRTWDALAPKVYSVLQRYKFSPNSLCYRDMYQMLVRSRSDDWY